MDKPPAEENGFRSLRPMDIAVWSVARRTMFALVNARALTIEQASAALAEMESDMVFFDEKLGMEGALRHLAVSFRVTGMEIRGETPDDPNDLFE